MSLFDTIRIMPAWLVVSETVAVTFGLVMAGYGLWQMRRERLQQLCQIKRLQEQPTRPMPAILLPSVLPAHFFDASDTTPDFGTCPECYLLWLHRVSDVQRTADGGYVMPQGAPALCAEHASSTLGRAIERKEMAR